MNHESASQIAFIERLAVPAWHTADQVFAELPFGASYASQLASVLCTGYLVSHLESLCIHELRQHVDLADELILGAGVQLRHLGPVRAGDVAEVRGLVSGLGDHSVSFSVDAWIGNDLVAQGTLHFAVVDRQRYEQRLASRAAPVAPRWQAPSRSAAPPSIMATCGA